jgi:hypothetical protein
MIKFNETQIKFVDDLLIKASKGKVHYSTLDYSSYDTTFQLVNNEPYKLFGSDGEMIWLLPLGNEIINDFNGSFKKYLENLNKEKDTDTKIKQLTLEDLQKTDTRSRTAFIVSIIAIISAFLIGLMQVYQTYYYNNKIENQTNNTKIQTDSASQINHSQFKRDSINKTSIKVIPDSSKH